MIFKVCFYIKLWYVIGSVIGFMLNWKLYCDLIIKYMCLKLSIWFFIYDIEMFYLCFNVLVKF